MKEVCLKGFDENNETNQQQGVVRVEINLDFSNVVVGHHDSWVEQESQKSQVSVQEAHFVFYSQLLN